MFSTLGVALVGFTMFASAEANAWINRANVVRAAEILEQEVEALDTQLHNVNAPAEVVQTMHHFEETAMEFAEIARRGTYQEANAEMHHIRQDIQLIRDQFARYPWLLSNIGINTEWRHVRTAYRNVDHQMFAPFFANRYTAEETEQLKADVEAMLQQHAQEQSRE
jgi:hypothetical protein